MSEYYIQALSRVIDPELGLDIVTLGFLHGIEVGEGSVHVTITLTSPLCPFRDTLLQEVRQALVRTAPEDTQVRVSVVFDPPWEPSPALRARLGL